MLNRHEGKSEKGVWIGRQNLASVGEAVSGRRGLACSAIRYRLSAFSLQSSALLLVLVLAMTLPALGRLVYVDDDAPAGGNGSSWSKAWRFLQDGLKAAADGDEIRVAQGVYKPDRSEAKPGGTQNSIEGFRLTQADMRLLGGWAGLSHTDPNVRDVRTYETVLNADLLGNDVVPPKDLKQLYVDKANPTRQDNTFTMLQIRGARTLLGGVTIVGARGGGCYVLADDVTVKDCTFRYNSSGVSDTPGAGGLSFFNGQGRVVGCSFYRNVASSMGGGVMCPSLLEDCEFIENYAWSEGGAAGWPLRVERCVFVRNSATGAGGAISLIGEASLRDCEFRENSASSGGAIEQSLAFDYRMEVINCTFVRNKASQFGGACMVYVGKGLTSSWQNCRMFGNRAGESGGAFYAANSGLLHVTSCTSSDNCAPTANFLMLSDKTYANAVRAGILDSIIADDGQVIRNGASSCEIAYSCLRGSLNDSYDPNSRIMYGPGNIDVDPCFAAPGYWDPNGTPTDMNDDFFIEGDYHLKSQAGRWDPVAKTWVQDAVTSPCIDAGDPNSPIGLEPFPNGGRINMGAYGGTAEASKSWFGGPVCQTIIAGDINGDCRVDFKDLSILVSHWLQCQ